jgi:autotransporter-associated beta strand protein
MIHKLQHCLNQLSRRLKLAKPTFFIINRIVMKINQSSLTLMKCTLHVNRPGSLSLTHIATTSLLALLALGTSSRAADATWGANGGTAWYTGANWAGGAFPGLQGAAASNADIATFTNVATATTFGINMNTNSLNLGAISIDSTRTAFTSIGNSSATPGEIRLYGATVNGVTDTIIRHNVVGITGFNTIAGTLTIQATQTGTMGLVLSNATNNKVNIDNSAAVVISANITGTGPLTKGGTGTGPLILSGTNTFTGATATNTGTLSFNLLASKSTGTHTFAAGTALGLGFGGATRFSAAEIQQAFGPTSGYTGNLAGIVIGDSNNIAIDTTGGAQTFSAAIPVSPRGLEKIFSGANLTLTGANQYSGRTVVWGGSALVVDSPGNTGDASSNLGTNSTVDLMTGAFFQITAPTAPVVSNKTFNVAAINGGTILIFGSGSVANSITLSGSITSETTGTKTVDFRTNIVGTHTVSGIISDGSGQLNVRKTNAGTWILSGANTYSGTTTVAGGTLMLGNSLAAQNSTLDTAASIAGTASAGLRTTATTLTLGGLSGSKNFAATGGVFTTTGGYNAVTALTLNPGTGAAPVYSAVIADGMLGMTLTKTGEGTQTLSGASAYTGATSVSQGTLLINNTTGSGTGGGDVTVASGAILGGTGAISGAVNITGFLSPGPSIETLGTGTLSFATGSTLVHELNSSVATSAGSDLLKVTGGLNLVGTVNLTLSDFALTDVAFTPGTVFSLINYTGSWNTGLFTIDGNELADEEVFTSGLNTWKISYNDEVGGLNFTGEYAGGADSFVNLTAVPEPSTALLGGLGLIALLRRRRR